MPSPRTLSIAHVDAETGFSGGEVQVFLLMEGLRRRGHRNVLIAPPGSRSADEAGRRGFEARTVPMRGDLDLPAVVRLKRHLGEARVDLVHLHTSRSTWLGGLAASWAGVRAITTRRQDKVLRSSVRMRLIYGCLVRRAVAISPAVARQLTDGSVGPEVVLTIPSAVDLGELQPTRGRQETRRELGLEEHAFVLLTLASLVPRKGVDVLIRALALLPESAQPCVLLVAGHGPERARLEDLARELELPGVVRFLGAREDKAELLDACDVFALASRAEGLGVAALEAMALARPVVASRVGGLVDVVLDGRTGLLVEPDDARALAAALDRLRADPGLRARFGEEGRRRMRDSFGAERMVSAYERLYQQVLDEDGPR